MASQQEQPAAPPPGSTTTITSLGDDLIREIFLRLPDLPSLVRAAFACHAFRRAVRSSPAFRRSFRALHAPPLLALFLDYDMEAVPVFPTPRRSSDPDNLVGADFFGIHHLSCDPHCTGWEIQSWDPSAGGYLILVKERLKRPKCTAAYSPLTQALDLAIYRPDYVNFEFYTLSSQDGQGPSRVVCIRHGRRLAEETAAFVFSSDSMEWQISLNATLQLRDPHTTRTAMVVRGLICWRGWVCDQIVLFDAATCHFSLIELPTPLKRGSTYRLGETKDEQFCIVDIKDNALVSWFMTANVDTVTDKWMMYKKFSLDPIVKKFIGCSIDEEGCHVSLDILAVIDGFVYLSITYYEDKSFYQLYLSLCLETSETSQLFKGAYRHNDDAYPYVMAWPPSLVQSKEETETEFTGDSVVGDYPMCTEEASNVLVTALQSFSQALMNDSDSNKQIVAELDAFLCPTEDEEGSLIRKITTLDAQLRTARDRILTIRHD